MFSDLFQPKRCSECEGKNDLKEWEVWVMLERKQNPLDSFSRDSPPIPWDTESIKSWAGRYPSCVYGVTAIWVEWLDAFLRHFCPIHSEDNQLWRLCSCPFFCGSSLWCFVMFAVVFTFNRCVLNRNFILLLLRSIHSWRRCRVHVEVYWHCREQRGCSVCFAGYRPCLSLPALCFLFSCLQSHVDSYPKTPKHVSGELLFNHMLPVFEQLKLQHHFLLVLV